MKGFYKSLRRLCAVIIGVVFFVAGILKLMDPVGAGFVVEEYLKFMHLGFLGGMSRALGVMMAMAETLVGAALVTGVWRKPVSWISGLLVVFFTLLTLVLLIVNPTMECGCFGEAIHLTHLQTFIKNLVLLALWVVAFVPHADLGKAVKIKYVTFSVTAISVALFTLYSILSIPMIDFTAFRPGTALLASVEDEWGFEDDADDPDAEVLSFYDMNGDYQDGIAAEGNVMIVSVYAPDKMSTEDWLRTRDYLSTASDEGFTPVLLVASAPSVFEEVLGNLDAASRMMLMMESYFADQRTLATLNRANGGATMISGGDIVAKWSARSLPASDLLSEMSAADPAETMVKHSTTGRLRMQGFLLYVFAVMLLL